MNLTPVGTINPVPIALGVQVGRMQPIHFGVPQAWRPVLTGSAVGPVEGWASLQDARAAVLALDPNQAQGDATGIFRQGDRIVAMTLLQPDGRPLRLWHIPTNLQPTDSRWVDTLSGPVRP